MKFVSIFRYKAFYILLTLIVIFLLEFFFFLHYQNKECHISIDDVSISMKDLTENEQRYSSIFDQDLFAWLRCLHNKTGAKFTLYVYEDDNEYSINEFPQKYKEEFEKNSSWLKIGYHAKNPSISKDSIANYEMFVSSFNNVDNNLSNKVGIAKAKIIRLHYFFATTEEVAFLKRRGVTYLLSADDNRISYSLSKSRNDSLCKYGELITPWGGYIKTDYRLEKSNVFTKLFRHANDDKLVVFTHEWALRKKSVRYKMVLLCYFLGINNVNFISI